jgi:toxin CptA
LLRGADAITAIELEDDGGVVHRRDGRKEHARLLASTYVSPCLTLLNLRVARRIPAQHIIIVPDNVEAEAFRRLRVWLRWGAAISDVRSVNR